MKRIPLLLIVCALCACATSHPADLTVGSGPAAPAAVMSVSAPAADPPSPQLGSGSTQPDAPPTTEAPAPPAPPAPPPITPGGPDDPWGPILCPGLPHPAHHQPCPAYTPAAVSSPVVVTPAPTSSAATATGACGGSLPPCWVMNVESRGNPKAYNPGGCYNPRDGTYGCYGKWQFMDSTWHGLGYSGHAFDYPESVQDEGARTLWAGGAGCSNWNAC